MASRRSLRKQPEREPQGRRRSLRVASQKAVPFNNQRSVAYQAPTTSALMDFATPRTVLKKVLQTQPIVSPFVSEKPDSPKPIDTIFHFPEKTDSSISLEVSLSDLSQRQKSKITRHPTRSKKIRLSVFERDLNNQLHSSTDQGLLDHTSLTKSLQISFTTPAPLNSAGKKGLMRRPKHYRGVNVKDFEGGLEQGLLQIKDSAENYPEDQKTTTLQSNNTEAQSVETELFLPPHSSEENNVELSNVPPEPDLARQSLGDGRAPSLSQTRLARQDEISDMEVEKVAESFPKKILAPGSKRTIEAETECTEEKDDRSKGRCQESPEGAEKGLRLSLGKENLSPGSEDASSTESISQKRRVTPQRQEQKNFHGNSPDEEISTPRQPLKTGLGARSSFSTWLSRKAARRPMNELVAHITQELDNLLPGVAGRQGLAQVDLEKGSSLREKTVEISQSPRVRTPNRRASGKTPRNLERTPFKEMRERTNPHTGGRNRTKEMRNVETEHILEFETEGNSEVEEMSESEDIAIEISQSPRVVTPKRRTSGKTPKSLERTPFKEMRERTNPQTGGRNKTKEMRNVETEQILEFETEGNSEVEMSESEDIAVEISQSPRVVTPNRRASGKTPKSLERTPFNEMRERTNPQTGGRNKTTGKRNVETEQILEFEDEDNPEVEMSEFEDIAIEIWQSPRVVTPKRRASGKTPKSLERTPFKEMRERTNPQTGGRNKTKEMRNVETEQILEFETEGNSEVEMSESEDIAVEISQSPRVVTPNRRASGKTSKSLERTPFKEMRERTKPQTGGRNRTKEMRNVETEQILEFETEGNSEVEEMSESEDIAIEISQSPRVVTPNRRASGKTPKSLERTPFKEMRERTNPQTGGRNKTKEMRNVETEEILEFEDEDNPEVEEMSESENIAVEISQSPRVRTPNRRASGKTPKSLERTPFKEMRERTNPQTGGRNKTSGKRNVETEEILEFEDEDNPEVEEMSESENIAIEISQSPGVVTPNRRASGKTPKSLERTPFKEMRERTNPQTGGRNKTTGKRNVETEEILEFEDEDNPEVEEMSESENIEPTGNTPAFVRAKAFHCTPLLASPRVLKEAASGSPVKQDSVQQLPKPAKKACPRKREPSLPNNLVKKLFTHHVKMPVTKEALEIVERCVNVYFKHLSNDLDAYVTHAGRKIADPADVELLMKRQGLITDKMPLHVLVERHLPFEYRKLLIPIATSGNKVIPQKPK